ncbi:MAG: YCF48-related protein [Ignavibacteriaceae bacterium]
MNIIKISKWIIPFLILFYVSINAQWIKRSFPYNENLFVVRFVSPETGWILGSEHIFKTTDGGNTWSAKDSVFSVWRGLYAFDEENVIYFDYDRGIRRTIDGGISWYTADSTIKDIVSFSFINPNLVFAAGGSNDSESVYKSIDKGKTWTKIFNDYLVKDGWDFEKVSFIDSLEGWAALYKGEIFHTIDGGYNWTFQDSTASGFYDVPLKDIQFITQDSGWAVGGIAGISIILRTTDGGKTWIDSTNPANITACSLREIYMLNSKIGWFTGTNNGPSFIAKTTDGGNTWMDETPKDEYLGFESIDIVNDSIGYLVGDEGRYYTTNDGGITGIYIDNENSVHQFLLSQNYPNPFNPTTTIQYSVPKESFVIIKVYNVLGKEIATLVSGRKPIGNYSVDFNSGNLSSGTYFYRLISGTYTATKKMVILK